MTNFNFNDGQVNTNTNSNTGGNRNKDYTTARIYRAIDRIKPIPKGKRHHALFRLGLVFLETFMLFNWRLEQTLRNINRTKCTPRLPAAAIARIARSVVEKAKRDTANTVGGIVCLSDIPTDEIDIVEDMIKALPYPHSYYIDRAVGGSQCLPMMLALLQDDIIDQEIDDICNDAISASDADVLVDETHDRSGVTTMTFTDDEHSSVGFQHEGDVPDVFLPQIEDILTGLVQNGVIRPCKEDVSE